MFEWVEKEKPGEEEQTAYNSLSLLQGLVWTTGDNFLSSLSWPREFYFLRPT